MTPLTMKAPPVRGKSGCLNCRKRRKRCDEQKPSCKRCQRHSDKCQWQPGFSFRLVEVEDGNSGVSTSTQSLPSASTKRAASGDWKIVDVTFGPEGQRRVRRPLTSSEGTKLVEKAKTSLEEHDQGLPSSGRNDSHTEVVHSDADYSAESAFLPLPTTDFHLTISSNGVEPGQKSKISFQQEDTMSLNPPVDSWSKREQTSMMQIRNLTSPSAEILHPMATGQPDFIEPAGLPAGVSAADHNVPFADTTCYQPISVSSLLTTGDSIYDEYMGLEALDYLAANPLNLDLLKSNSWSNPTGSNPDILMLDAHDMPENDANIFATYYHDPTYQELQSMLRHQIMRSARNVVMTRQATAEPFEGTSEMKSAPAPSSGRLDWEQGLDVRSSGVITARGRSVRTHLSEKRYIELWQNYINEIAPWLDLYDNANSWSTVVAYMAHRVECVECALLALSARQQERMNPGRSHTESLNLYLEAIRLTMRDLPTLSTEVIAACVLLCVLEMMCSSPRAWGEHLDGCSILLEAAGINGVVGGVEEAIFWTFARMEVYRAYIGSTVTTPPTNRWFISADSMSAAVRLFKEKPGSDSYGNYVVFLCAGVMNILSKKRSTLTGSDHGSYSRFVSQWKAMYDLHEGWYDDRLEELRPLLQISSTREDTETPFSTILFGSPLGISCNLMYHASLILLLQNKPQEIQLPPTHKTMWWHAHQIIAIAITNKDHAARIHGLQPMWIAGKLMERPSERKAVLKLLDTLERETGWATAWRACDLKDYWGTDALEV